MLVPWTQPWRERREQWTVAAGSEVEKRARRFLLLQRVLTLPVSVLEVNHECWVLLVPNTAEKGRR